VICHNGVGHRKGGENYKTVSSVSLFSLSAIFNATSGGGERGGAFFLVGGGILNLIFYKLS